MEKILNKFTEGATESIGSLYWLSLAVMGNFIGESLSCKTQYTLTNNMYLKNLLIIMIIFTGLDATSDIKIHPLNLFMKSFLIWIFFTAFNRMRPFNTAIVTILIIILFILKVYKEYLEQENKKSPTLNINATKEKKRIEYIEKGAILVILTNIIIGTLIYYMDKRREYGTKFDIMKFIFGVPKCESLKE